MSTGLKIFIGVVVFLVLASLAYVAWRLLRGGDSNDPATDISGNGNSNNTGNNNTGGGNNNGSGNNNPPPPDNTIRIGDKLYATGEVRAYPYSLLSSPTPGVTKKFQNGAYVGQVSIIGSTEYVVDNFGYSCVPSDGGNYNASALWNCNNHPTSLFISKSSAVRK